jgi:hypothetical protein
MVMPVLKFNCIRGRCIAVFTGGVPYYGLLVSLTVTKSSSLIP